MFFSFAFSSPNTLIMNTNEINVVVMNVDIGNKATKTQKDWEEEVGSFVEKLLTPKENPPNFIIFYQEGDEAKYSFLRKKMRYTVNYTEEGNGQTNGMIYHRSFKMTDPTVAIETKLNLPPPYFFMLDSHRFNVAIYCYGVQEEHLNSLLVSFHAPNIAKGLTNIEKAKIISLYLTIFDQMRVAHKCQTMIVAGDFNIKYSDLLTTLLLEDLDLKVMGYDLEFVPVNERTETHYGHHRAQNPGAPRRGRKKEKVDTVIYSKIISRVSNVVIDKDIPADIMDHHAILVSLKLPNQAEMVQWEEDKALAEGIAWLRL